MGGRGSLRSGFGPIYWPIEEATWPRVDDSKVLSVDFVRGYLEGTMQYRTDPALIEDLVSFQVFILLTMDRKEPLKTHESRFAWKDFRWMAGPTWPT